MEENLANFVSPIEAHEPEVVGVVELFDSELEDVAGGPLIHNTN